MRHGGTTVSPPLGYDHSRAQTEGRRRSTQSAPAPGYSGTSLGLVVGPTPGKPHLPCHQPIQKSLCMRIVVDLTRCQSYGQCVSLRRPSFGFMANSRSPRIRLHPTRPPARSGGRQRRARSTRSARGGGNTAGRAARQEQEGGAARVLPTVTWSSWGCRQRSCGDRWGLAGRVAGSGNPACGRLHRPADPDWR